MLGLPCRPPKLPLAVLVVILSGYATCAGITLYEVDDHLSCNGYPQTHCFNVVPGTCCTIANTYFEIYFRSVLCYNMLVTMAGPPQYCVSFGRLPPDYVFMDPGHLQCQCTCNVEPSTLQNLGLSCQNCAPNGITGATILALNSFKKREEDGAPRCNQTVNPTVLSLDPEHHFDISDPTFARTLMSFLKSTNFSAKYEDLPEEFLAYENSALMDNEDRAALPVGGLPPEAYQRTPLNERSLEERAGFPPQCPNA